MTYAELQAALIANGYVEGVPAGASCRPVLDTAARLYYSERSGRWAASQHAS